MKRFHVTYTIGKRHDDGCYTVTPGRKTVVAESIGAAMDAVRQGLSDEHGRGCDVRCQAEPISPEEKQ